MAYRIAPFAILAFAALLAGCDSPADLNRKAELTNELRAAQADDMALAQPLDTRRTALIEHAGEENGCDGYCLRLLYGGEADCARDNLRRTPATGAGACGLFVRSFTPRPGRGRDEP